MFARKLIQRIQIVIYLLVVLLTIGALQSWGERKNWQAGTIIEVKARRPGSEQSGAPRQYEISVKVGKKIYVALYLAEKGQPEPDNCIGMQRTVLIDGNILKINDLLGRTRSLRIESAKESEPASK